MNEDHRGSRPSRRSRFGFAVVLATALTLAAALLLTARPAGLDVDGGPGLVDRPLSRNVLRR